MKKIFLVAVAAVFLSGMTTSCVDMPETKGVEEVYSARAEFIKAQAALKAAEVKLKEAQVATQNAITKQVEATARAQELSNARDQARTDASKQYYDLQLAMLQAQSERDLVQTQITLANAQKEYQEALAQLEIAKVFIPEMYQDQLRRIVRKLDRLSRNIVMNQSRLVGLNFTLDSYIAKDSVRIATNLKANVTYTQRNLALATETLNLAKEAKTGDLEAVKATVATKIKEQSQELETAKSNMVNAYVEMDKAGKELDSLYYKMFVYADYRANVAIPEAVRADFRTYFNSSLASNSTNKLSSDGATYSYIGSLNGLISQLQAVLTEVGNQESANPSVTEWTTLKQNVQAQLDTFTAQRAKLENEYNDMWIEYRAKWYEYITYRNQSSYLMSNVDRLYDLQNTLGNNINAINDQIATREQDVINAQVSYNDAVVRLESFKKNGVSDEYSTSQIKGIRDAIAELTQRIADQQTEFDLLNKQKNALVEVINNLGK